MNASRPPAVIATLFYQPGPQCLQAGFDELDSASAVALMAPPLKQQLATEAAARWWQAVGPMLYVDEFRDRVNRAIAAHD